MKTYEIVLVTNTEDTQTKQSVYIKSDAESRDIQHAINFVKLGERYIERLLQALRVLGHKAQEVKINPIDIFEVE